MVKIILSYKCYQKERKQADEINVNEMSTEIQNDENTENQNGYAVDDEGWRLYAYLFFRDSKLVEPWGWRVYITDNQELWWCWFLFKLW